MEIHLQMHTLFKYMLFLIEIKSLHVLVYDLFKLLAETYVFSWFPELLDGPDYLA